MDGGFSIDLFPCLPTLLPMDPAKGPNQPWGGLGSALPHPMPFLLLLSTTRLTVTCGCEGLVDVDPIPPPNRGVQKGHDPGRKKERKKERRKKKKKNRKPTQQDGGREEDTTEPPDKHDTCRMIRRVLSQETIVISMGNERKQANRA